MAFFFRLLYHPLAWSYDFVAWIVSLGRWEAWVKSILPRLDHPGNVLELGFGPGHLQASLHEAGFTVFGLDESMQMSRIARRRLSGMGFPLHLARGRAETIPFASGCFDTVVSTFPTPYIYQDLEIAEIYRILRPSGKLIILFAALQPGNSLPEKLVHLLFQVTHQAPPVESKFESLLARYEPHGFTVTIAWHGTPHGNLLILEGVRQNVKKDPENIPAF
jgi:ubiquinone/menaquinone biosynthesis C-methylase UbiE